MTRREYCELVKKPIPDPPEIPYGCEWVLNGFYALRGFQDEWRAPIKPGDMLDWQRLSGDYLSPDIAVIIMTMDRVYRVAMSEFHDKQDDMRREK